VILPQPTKSSADCACSCTIGCWSKSRCINFGFVSLKYKISQYTPCNNHISGVKITVNGITYDVYTHSDANTSANAELWIQKGITILDAKPPTIAISSNVSKLKAGESVTITFTLSEASSDFTKDDVSVLGGVLSDIILKFGETKVYTATFTPTANSVTTGTISVASDKFSVVSKSVDISLRVKVMVVLSPALSLSVSLLMIIVGTLVSIVKNTELFTSAP
jgi:hypothetical protein